MTETPVAVLRQARELNWCGHPMPEGESYYSGPAGADKGGGRTIWIADAHRGEASVTLCARMKY